MQQIYEPKSLLLAIQSFDNYRTMKAGRALESLAALAQESRLAVFRLLVRAGPDGMPAGTIAKAVAVPASTMSTHLFILTHAGLIKARRESRTIFYTLDGGAVRALFDFLASDCCGGRPELCAPLSALIDDKVAKPASRRPATKRRV